MSLTCEDYSCPLCAGYSSDEEDNESTNSMLRELGKTHPFVKHVKDVDGEDNPMVILYTDQQLVDIKRFCCRRGGGTPLGLDTTHKYGNFQLTFTVYKDLSVVRKSQTTTHPICFGPSFIHHDTDSQTNVLSSFLEKIAMNLSAEEVNNLTIGSRQEPAIVTSVKRCVSTATHVFCTTQIKQKLNKFMKDKVGYSLEDRKDISEAIFGLNGLTSVTNNDALKAHVTAVRTLIGQKDDDVTKSDKPMRSYFDKELLPLLCASVIKPFLKEKIPKHWTNNNAMSAKQKLKLWMNDPPYVQTMPEFIERLYTIVKFETCDRADAILMMGKYSLDERFLHHQIDEYEWINKSKQEKDRRIIRFQSSRGRPQQSKVSSSNATKPSPPAVAVKNVSTVPVVKRTSTITVSKSATSTVTSMKSAASVTIEKRMSTPAVVGNVTTVPRSTQVKRKLTDQSGTTKRVKMV